VVAVLAFIKRLSLIPVLGLLSCTYLSTQLGVTNWSRFVIWLLIGLAIYFLYGRKFSKVSLAKNAQEPAPEMQPRIDGLRGRGRE
jgi:positive regulator of sigma E activity